MSKIIGIVSGKGGVGKTTLCANLAFALAKRGNNVIAIDGDIGLKNLDILLGMVDKSAYDLTDILCGRCTVAKAIQVHDNYCNLHFISASQSSYTDELDRDALFRLCRFLRTRYDYVLIDAPAGVGDGFHNIVSCCDECVVVATPDLTSIRDAEKTSSLLSAYPKLSSKLVLNKINKQMISQGYLNNIDDIMDCISLPLVGLIPTDELIVVYGNGGTPVADTKSPCAKPFMNIADRLSGKDIPLDKMWYKK